MSNFKHTVEICTADNELVIVTYEQENAHPDDFSFPLSGGFKLRTPAQLNGLAVSLLNILSRFGVGSWEAAGNKIWKYVKDLPADQFPTMYMSNNVPRKITLADLTALSQYIRNEMCSFEKRPISTKVFESPNNGAKLLSRDYFINKIYTGLLSGHIDVYKFNAHVMEGAHYIQSISNTHRAGLYREPNAISRGAMIVGFAHALSLQLPDDDLKFAEAIEDMVMPFVPHPNYAQRGFADESRFMRYDSGSLPSWNNAQLILGGTLERQDSILDMIESESSLFEEFIESRRTILTTPPVKVALHLPDMLDNACDLESGCWNDLTNVKLTESDFVKHFIDHKK